MAKSKMQMKYLGICIVVIVIIAAASLYYFKDNTPPVQNYIYSSVNASQVAAANNNFTFKIYSKLSNGSNDSDNIFFSPFSIYTALSMTAEGARGNTSKQMQTVLGSSTNLITTRTGFESILGSLNSQKGVTLSIADSIRVEKTFPINPEFSSALSSYYGAIAYVADFKNNSAGETTDINNWVSSKTNQKINNLIPQGDLDVNTTLVLADAVYFKGNWAKQFDKQNTSYDTFFTPSQNVQVPMMHLTTNASYYSNNDLQALELNYQNSNLSMLILLPLQNQSFSQVESTISASQINNITSGLSTQDVAISLPKFNMTLSEELNGILVALGMRNAFNKTAANLSGMGIPGSVNPNNNLYISHVLHKAFIQVNEQGTQAAAATAVVVSGVTAIARPMPITFDADHPFLFFIVDRQSGTILFMGRASNPAT